MDERTFKTRTKKLAVAIIKEIDELPRSLTSDVIGKQLVRPGTSMGANYRAACRQNHQPI
jgi:four helix bundle protein